MDNKYPSKNTRGIFKHRPLVFPFEWVYTSNFWAFYSLLLGVSQGSVLKAVY